MLLSNIIEADFSPAVPQLHCGHRLYVVAREGRKHITVISPASLESVRVPVEAFHRLASLPRSGTSARRIAALIRRNVAAVHNRRDDDAAPPRLPRQLIAEALRRLRRQRVTLKQEA